MDVIVLPDDGIKPLLKAANSAKKTLDLIIFRFDLKEVEKALAAAVTRGVAVRALIAHTNPGLRSGCGSSSCGCSKRASP